ncbi:MAG: 3-isopropylmalate dehydratase large subunit [Pseudomonadota bacterium]|nr:MAG: 3-isopropylmalate dehydratase large subunit [Pseudomonadota bacterium]
MIRPQNVKDSLPQTLAQKIIARAAGKAEVEVGEIEIGSVDLAMIHDSGGPRRVAPILERLGVEVWDPEKLVVVTDHYVPVFDAESRAILDLARDWVKKQGVARFHDEEGICHVVLPENGYLKPGMFVVGGDSHSPTGGAFGCYMFGIGATEMAGVLATGEIWIRVPETIRIEWEGTFQEGVMAKDVMLFLCGRLGMDGGRYQAVEYCGEAVSELSMQERMTLSNMSAELGAQAGLIAPDATTMKWLEDHGSESDQSNHGKLIQMRISNTIALMQTNWSPKLRASQSSKRGFCCGIQRHPSGCLYLGACTGAKLHDLRAAASILKENRVQSGIEFWVAPSSKRDFHEARKEGVMKILEDAGAKILPTSCGLCAGYGPQRLGQGTVCLSSTARNFKGRMGDESSEVYLASPMTVASTAITGYISDPRNFLGAS